jgi:hypothetical protein
VQSDGLFLDTLEDLRRRTNLRAAEYDMVQAAGLLRRLVLDKSPLWAEVNREHRLKPECVWQRLHVATAARNGPAWVPWWWLDPEIHDMHPLHARETLEPWRGPIGKFLQHVVIRRAPHELTVQELISHYAHWEGGVHFKTSPPQSDLLSDIREESEEALRLTVLAIGRIIHRALTPLSVHIVIAQLPHPHGINGVTVVPAATSAPSS